MNKPVVLLYWGYHRPGWIKVFESCKSDFNFIYISHISPAQEKASFTDCPKLYWSDFKNADEIVAKVRPDKVVFMGLDGPLAILLNAACRKRKIRTYFLQHGIFHPYRAYLQEEKLEKQSRVQAPASGDAPEPIGRFAMQFMLRSLSLSNLGALFAIIQLKLLRKLLGSAQKALYYTQYPVRRVQQYIVYTKFSSSMLAERDGVPNRLFHETGNPEADEAIAVLAGKNNEPLPGEDRYYLLIDDPLGEVKEYNTGGFISSEAVVKFHLKLNEFAMQNGRRLKIKLHPYSYGSGFFPQHDNITYVKDADIPALISGSDGIFGILSTLMIPALYMKPCCVFRFNDKYDFHSFLASSGYCKVLNYLDFNVNEVVFNTHVTAEERKAFIDAYLYKDDGLSLQRIKQALLSNN